ncbi:unnamed protein product, partial [Sphagnum jensenii]
MIPLAVSSSDRTSKCWSEDDSPLKYIDLFNRFVETKVSSKYSVVQKLPLYVFGASSGGAFVSLLGTSSEVQRLTQAELAGVIVQISPFAGLIYREPKYSPMSVVPIVFIHMYKDSRIARTIVHTVAAMKKHTMPARVYVVHEKPLHENYFMEKRVLTAEQSAIFVQALNAAGYLSDSNYLIEDPRETDWRQ